MTNWHNLEIENAFDQLDSRPDGLTDLEASERLKQWGSNLLESRKTTSWIKLLLKQFANYFILVLLFAAGLAFAVSYLPGQGDRKLTAYFILGILLISVLLGFFEEYRSQKELEAVSRLLMFHTNVLRSGVRREIDAVQVVPGDMLVLSQGQKVPADARLIEAHSLRTDESTLTGESLWGRQRSKSSALGNPPGRAVQHGVRFYLCHPWQWFSPGSQYRECLGGGSDCFCSWTECRSALHHSRLR